MKKILITILFMLAAIGAYGQNKFKYQVQALGGISIGNTADTTKIDSAIYTLGVLKFYRGSAEISVNWNTAYTDRLKWDGGATGLTAATGRTSLGGTTVGQALFTLTNPSAVTFPRINADNTVTALSASNALTAIGGANTALSNLASVAINTHLLPGTDGAVNLGSATYKFGDIHQDSAKSINWNNSDVIITHSSNSLTVGGGTLNVSPLQVGSAASNTIMKFDSISIFNNKIYFFKGVDTIGVGSLAADEVDINTVAVTPDDSLTGAGNDYYVTDHDLDLAITGVTFDTTYVHYRIDSLVTAVEDINTVLAAYVPPLFSSAEVGDSASRLLRVIMSKDMVTDSIPDDEQFVFTEGVDEIDITSVSISNDTLFLVLATTPQKDSTLLVDYTKPNPTTATNHTLEDSNENETKTWTNKSVTNNGYVPTITKIELGDFADDTVLIVWNKYLDQDSVPPQAAFTFKEAGTTYGLDGISIGSDSMFIALDSIGVHTVAYTLTYARAWPYLQDSAGYYASNFTNTAVTNSFVAPVAYTDNFESYSTTQNLVGLGNWIAGLNDIRFVDDTDNKIRPYTGTAYQAAIYNDDFDADQYSQIIIDDVGSGFIGVGVRLTGSAATLDGYGLLLSNGGKAYIGRWDDGVWTELANGNCTLTADDELKLTVVGSTLSCYKNDALITTLSGDGILTDATYATGKAGVAGFNNTTGIYGDDWEGGNMP